MRNAVLVVAILSLFALGAMNGTAYVLRTDNYGWSGTGASCETTTVYTSPAVDERDYTTFKANHTDAVYFEGLDEYNAACFRFIVDDEADATVFDVFVSKGQDYFTRIGTVTLAGGTQIAPDTSTDTTSAVFCDTLTISNEYWISTLTAVDGGAGDRISMLTFDLCGFDTVAFVGTTVGDTTLIQSTGY